MNECKRCQDKLTIIKNLTKKLRDATKNDGTGGSLESLLKEKRVRRYKFLGYDPGEIGQEIVEDEKVLLRAELDAISIVSKEWVDENLERAIKAEKAFGDAIQEVDRLTVENHKLRSKDGE